MARRPTYINKWATLAASLTALLVAGLGYLFPLYADDLKHALAVDQRGIDAVAAAANLGSYLSAPAGAVVDHLAAYPRAGPRITMAVGCGIMHAGFLALAVAAKGGGGRVVPSAFGFAPDPPGPPPPDPPSPPGPAPPPPPPPPSPPSPPPPPPPPSLAFAAAAAFAASNGATWLDATVMAAAVRNHARQRGPAAGVLKGAVGLSASLFTVIYAAAFAGDKLSAPRFLTFLSIAPPSIALAVAPFVNVVPFDQADEWGGGGGRGGSGHSLTPSARFGAAGAILAALALYSASATVVLRGPAAASLSASARATVVGGMVAVAAMLALLPAGAGGLIARPAPGQGGGDEDEEGGGHGADHEGVTAALLEHGDGGDSDDDDGAASHASDDTTTPTPLLPSVTLSGALRSHKFGLLFFTSFVVGGCGLTFINNAGALAASLSAPSDSAAAIVSSFSVFNCGGRLAFGALSEHAMHGSSRVPRPAFIIATAALASASALAAALTPAPALPAVAAAMGAAFGGQWALMAAYVADVLSVKHFALLYSMLQLAPAAGSLGLARGLAGTLYDRAAEAQGTPGYCEGRICFKLTFLICAGLGVCATVAAAALTLLSRGPYARLTDALAADDADRASLAAAAEAALAAARWRGRAARAARRASLGSPPRSAPPPEVEGGSPRTPASATRRRVTTALDRLSATERRLARRSASLRAEWW